MWPMAQACKERLCLVTPFCCNRWVFDQLLVVNAFYVGVGGGGFCRAHLKCNMNSIGKT